MPLFAFASEAQVYKLKNGQTVIIQQVKTNPIVTIDTWIKTGSKNYLPCLVERNYIKFSAWLHNNNRFEAYEKMLKWYKEHPFKDKTKEKVDSE